MRVCPTCRTELGDDAAFCPVDADILVAVPDPTSPDACLGMTLGGRWRLVARVADGANGRVYEARDVGDRSRLAVKVLHAEVAKDPTNCERLRREAETTLQLAHPHILRMIGYFHDPPDLHYVVM